MRVGRYSPRMQPRQVVDYSLARRTLVEDVRRGRVPASDVCDAHDYLLRAARHHGEATGRACPICRREQLIQVNYVYGDELGMYEGRVKASAELDAFAANYSQFSVYEVEVCPACTWNHLVRTYLLGDLPAQARRRRAAR